MENKKCDFCLFEKECSVYATDYAPISLSYCEDCSKIKNLRTQYSALYKYIRYGEKVFNECKEKNGNNPMVYYKNKYISLEDFIKNITYDDYEKNFSSNEFIKNEGLKIIEIKKKLTKKRLKDMKTFKQKIEAQILEALKSSNSELLFVLRDIKSQLVKEEKDNNKNQELDETQTFKVVEKMAKSRKQSIDLFVKGNRPDLAEKEQKELLIIESYLPKKLSTEDVQKIVQEIVKTNNYQTKRETSLVIKKFNESYPGMSDGGTISKMCLEYLV